MEQMKHFIDTGTTVRVSVTDGRVFTGTLGCVDKQLNVVLINATETFKKKKKKSKRGGKEKEKRGNEEKEEENNRDDDVETSSSSSPRVINMALIAREHRVKMERLVEEEEKEKEKENSANTKSLLESARKADWEYCSKITKNTRARAA